MFLYFSFSSASNKIISARDHASIQINIADLDPVTGIMTDKYKTYAICGEVRQMVFIETQIVNIDLKIMIIFRASLTILSFTWLREMEFYQRKFLKFQLKFHDH